MIYMSKLVEGFNTKAGSPEKFMDVSVRFGQRVPSVPQHDDQSKEHPHEGTYLDQSRGQRVCVSAFHPDIGSPLHDEQVIAVERNRIRTSVSGSMSLTECGHP